MERSIFILILGFVCYSSAQDCNRYICNNDLREDLCMVKEVTGSNITYQLKECSEGRVCDLREDDSEARCNNWYTTPLKYPGEYCRNNSECFSGECHANHSICVGRSESLNCESDDICNPGFYCDANTRKCTSVKKINESCSQNEKCASYLICNKEKCIVHASLDENAIADHPHACKSYFVSNGICKNGSKLKRGENDPKFGPIPCPETVGRCTYVLDGSENAEPCICGITNNTAKYCPPGRGDLILDDVFPLLIFDSILNTSEIRVQWKIDAMSREGHYASLDKLIEWAFIITVPLLLMKI